MKSNNVVKTIKKPWGYEEIWGDIDGTCLGKCIFISMRQRLSRQYHKKKEEVIYVIRGVLRLEIGENADGDPEEVLTGGPGFSYHIKPGVIHRFCSNGGDVFLCEVSTYFPDDVVRIKDDYKR
jgi:quercetin dioxygenase-like cupin family protein